MTHHPRLLPALVATLALIGAAGCSKTPTATVAVPAASAPAANVSDTDVTEHVMTALNQAESLKGTSVTVVTTNGDVRLTGVLNTQVQIDEVLRIARAADGTHAIHDELTLRK